MDKKILVTGGAGYIGSHTVLALLEANNNVLVLDSLCNSTETSIKRVEKLTGKSVTFIKGDVNDELLLDSLFTKHDIEAVIHFAGLKAVGESVAKPLLYYLNNVQGSLSLFRAMEKHGVHRLVFSSSATVYGEPNEVPITEACPTSVPTNPYGKSKLMVEQILEDLSHANAGFSVAILRYFNPIGAHESGKIGEDPNGIPNNLMPYISQVAIGKLDKLAIFGNDYPTKDGTGIRDYIHVSDLADGHLKALDYLTQHAGCFKWNLGTGTGYSVLDIVSTFETETGVPVPYEFSPRRVGDVAQNWASPEKAQQELGWKAERTLADMMNDTWRWQSNNPNGYDI